ncbi:MAG TPA: hypothetical protein VFB74_32580 [Kribbellaceae bacterium]|nr:hypothetical protein [Kribbellaceae bacterium]
MAALSEAGLLQAGAEAVAQGAHRPGYGAHLDESPPLGDQFTFACCQLLLSLTECPIAALEGLQVDDLGQVGVEQPGPLPICAGPDRAEDRQSAPQLAGDPGATLGPFERAGDRFGVPQHGAQVSPHELVELRGRGEPRRAALGEAGADGRQLAAATVVAIARLGGRARAADTRQVADPAADEAAQQVGMRGTATGSLLIRGEPPLDSFERLSRHEGRHRHGDPGFRRLGLGAHATPHSLERRSPSPRSGRS